MDLEILIKYFPDLSSEQLEKYEEFRKQFAFWNEKINLISRKDLDSFYERHVLHSLAIVKFFDIKPYQKVMDIGTGGGFPGLPLAIYFPDTQFTLVDSIGKKIKAIEEISKSLQLQNVIIINDRAENIDGKFHYITNRAVAPLSNLWKWTKGKYVDTQKFKGGLISLKGGDLASEMQKAGKKVEQIELSKIFEEPFFETKKILHIRV